MKLLIQLAVVIVIDLLPLTVSSKTERVVFLIVFYARIAVSFSSNYLPIITMPNFMRVIENVDVVLRCGSAICTRSLTLPDLRFLALD